MSVRTLLAALVGLTALVVGLLLWASSQEDRASPISSGNAPPRPPTELERVPSNMNGDGEHTATVAPGQAVDDPSTGRIHLSSALEAELADGYWVAGRVVFPPDTPADEHVFIRAHGRKLAGGGYHRVAVHADGSFRVAFAPKTRKGTLRLEARYLYLPELVPFDVRTAPPQTLEPKLGARLHGRLLLPEDCPVAKEGLIGHGVELAAYRRRTPDRDTRITEELTYEFGGLWPDSAYELDLDVAGLLPVHLDNLRFSPGEVAVLDLELRVGAALAGRVLSDAGEPIAAAHVSAHSDAGPGRDTKTEQDGSFRIEGVAAGSIRLSAHAEGFLPTKLELGLLATREHVAELQLVLNRGRFIAGRVRWPDGTPAAGADVYLDGRAGPSAFNVHASAEGRTDADGSFRIAGLEQGDYRVTARATHGQTPAEPDASKKKPRPHPRSETWRSPPVAAVTDTADLVLELGRGLLLRGRVVDDLGAPIQRFRVHAFRTGDFALFEHEQHHRLQGSFENAAGSFELNGFGAGDWTVLVTAKPHRNAEAQLKAPEDLDGAIFRCGRPARVRGVVRGPTGAAVPGATVTVSQWSKATPPRASDPPTGVADGTGAFEIGSLMPGAARLTAKAPGWGESETVALDLQPGELRTGVELLLRPSGSIEVEVVGGEVAGREIQISAPWPVSLQCNVRTDEAGFARAENLTPGEYRLTLEPAPGEVRALAGDRDGRSAIRWLRRRGRVTVAAGAVSHVALALPETTPIRVAGVVSSAGEPLGDVSVNMASASGSDANRTDAKGHYELLLPGPRNYLCRVRDWNSGTSYQTQVTIPDVHELELDIAVPVSGHITGHVLDARGNPAARITVSALSSVSSSVGGTGSAMTAEDGAYELIVPPGTYRVLASGNRGGDQNQDRVDGPAEIDGLVVTAGGKLQGIDLQLTQAGTLRGLVRAAEERSGRAVHVTTFDGHGRPTGRAFCKAHGGEFEIRGLAPGPTYVRASREGSASAFADVDIRVDEVTEGVELLLEPAASLSVDVRNARERDGVFVFVEDDAGHLLRGSRVPGEARWRFPSLHPGSYSATAQNGTRWVQAAAELRAGETTELWLDIE